MLHQKIELHAGLSAEEAEAVFRSELKTSGQGFHGKEQNGGFRADYQGRGLNAFHPEIHLHILPEEEGGSLLLTELRMARAMLVFMLLWTLIPVILAVFGHNWLALIVIPVFWAIAVVGFRMGVKAAKEALMALFDAVEEVG